ncbi:hypothetical protein [Pseudonocardia sp. T1-2H]|uniref:hypothetical protein n=1 Tax=Pseudonocardia sp. T1-2H TaxID=3128899 RepID=UPI003101A62C
MTDARRPRQCPAHHPVPLDELGEIGRRRQPLEGEVHVPHAEDAVLAGGGQLGHRCSTA